MRRRRRSRRSARKASARAIACRRRSASPMRSPMRSALHDDRLAADAGETRRASCAAPSRRRRQARARRRRSERATASLRGEGSATVACAAPSASGPCCSIRRRCSRDSRLPRRRKHLGHAFPRRRDAWGRSGERPLRADVRLSDLDPPHAVTLGGSAEGALGFGGGEGASRLTPAGNGGTAIRYVYEAAIGGKVASIGGRLLDGAARVIIGQFFAVAGAPGGRWPHPIDPVRRLLRSCAACSEGAHEARRRSIMSAPNARRSARRARASRAATPASSPAGNR